MHKCFKIEAKFNLKDILYNTFWSSGISYCRYDFRIERTQNQHQDAFLEKCDETK